MVLHRLAALAFRTWRYNVVQWCMFCVPVACGPLPGRACKCTLPPFAAIWAGSAVRHQVCMMVRRCDGPSGVVRTASTEVFITLQVVNPNWPLRRCSLRNVWCLRSSNDLRHGYKPQTSSNYRCCGLHATMTAHTVSDSIALG